MSDRIGRSHFPIDGPGDRIRSASGDDVAENGSPGCRFPSVLLLVGVGFFAIGFLLVILGSAGPPSSGGCFFWPFPVIVVCGPGSGGGPFLLVGLFATVLTSLIIFLGWWTRKPGAQVSPGGAQSIS